MNSTPDTYDDWRSPVLPGDPPHLEEAVNGVLEMLTSAQLLNADWNGDHNRAYRKAWEVWNADMPRLVPILKKVGALFPFYPVEIYYRCALHSFLDPRTRGGWFDGDSDYLRDEFRAAIRWSRNLVTDSAHYPFPTP